MLETFADSERKYLYGIIHHVSTNVLLENMIIPCTNGPKLREIQRIKPSTSEPFAVPSMSVINKNVTQSEKTQLRVRDCGYKLQPTQPSDSVIVILSIHSLLRKVLNYSGINPIPDHITVGSLWPLEFVIEW